MIIAENGKKARVCHVTSVHDSTDVRVFKKECVSLAKKYDVFLVAKGESREESGVNVIGVGEAPKNRLKRMASFSKKVFDKAFSLSCDIYHFHDPELLPFALKMKRKGKIVIFDSHEMYSEQICNRTYLRKWIRNLIAALYSLYERYVMKKLDAVIFPCLINGKHPFEGRCNIVETVDNFPIISELYDRYDKNCKKIANSACYVGSISANRGVTNFIKAASIVNGLALLGGPFDSREYEIELKSMTEYKNVNYFGLLNREQVFNIISSSMVGMANLKNVGQYNKYDNLATKVYEYMSLGVPVILSKSPFNEMIMGQYNFGICVDPDNIEETADAMNRLFKDEELRKMMGNNGRMAVKNHFNWLTEERKLFQLYDTVLGNNPI